MIPTSSAQVTPDTCYDGTPEIWHSVRDAQKTIDEVVQSRTSYANKSRKSTICCLTICCTPCCLYSSIVRILSCPVQCMCNPRIRCNPLAACLTDSCLTSGSDSCITAACDQVNKKNTVNRASTRAENLDIIKYAASKIIETQDMKIKYAVTDAVAPVLRTFAFLKEPTPALVLEIAASTDLLTMKVVPSVF